MATKTDYREITVCRNDLHTVDCTEGLVTGFDHDVRSNVQKYTKYNVCSHCHLWRFLV